jgi:S1-C subfamily serine protease
MRSILAILLLVGLIHSQTVDPKITRAIVKVYTAVKSPSYKIPWSSSIYRISGSGSIIGGKMILTNAHVVANSSFIEVQRYGERKRYIAHVKAVSHQLDLALLSVEEEEEFFEDIEPLEIGKLPFIGDEVSVYGFPLGGDTMSVTNGIVSRVEHQKYAHSGEYFLTIQIDAAVNSGNSGGPAISNGKIVGVVMENLSKAQNISYLIPPVMIEHFFKDIRDGKLDGVPDIGFLAQNMQNPTLKKYFKVDDNYTGILIDKILENSEAKKYLKEGDAIVEIDGHKIENDSTINFRDKEFTNYNYYIELHQRGEKVNLKILRDGKVKSVDIPLKYTSNDFLVIKGYEYDKMPRYLIVGGYIFAPLTKNLIISAGARSDLLPFVHKLVTKDLKEIVVLQRVLPSEISRGNYQYSYWVVEKLNGKKFDSFKTFVDMIENTKGYAVLENDDGEKIVIDMNASRELKDEILERYNIEYDRSIDLREKK